MALCQVLDRKFYPLSDIEPLLCLKIKKRRKSKSLKMQKNKNV